MATQVSQKWAQVPALIFACAKLTTLLRYAQRVAKQLASLMKENAPTFDEIDHLINQ